MPCAGAREKVLPEEVVGLSDDEEKASDEEFVLEDHASIDESTDEEIELGAYNNKKGVAARKRSREGSVLNARRENAEHSGTDLAFPRVLPRSSSCNNKHGLGGERNMDAMFGR